MGDERSNDAGWSGDVPTTPIEFVFGVISHRGSHPASSSVPDDAARKPTVSTPIRRWLISIAMTIGLIGAAIAVATLSDGPVDESSMDLASESTTPAASAAQATAAPVLSTTTGAATTAPVDEGLPAAWQTEVIALPERFRAMSTQIRMFALASSGVLYDIDVQTGTMQSLELDSTHDSSRLHVASTSVLITSNNGSTQPLLVPDGGQPIELPVRRSSGGAYIQGVATNGIDYVAQPWKGERGRSTQTFLRADGTVDEVEQTDEAWRPAGGYAIDEELIVDAGGLYLESADGTARRISDGLPVAVSAASVLARECDEQRQCDYVIIDLVEGERAAAVVPDWISFNNGQYTNPILAPDGHSVLLSSSAFSGVTALFLDLLDGTTTSVWVGIDDEYESNTSMWASDSSGVFTSEQGKISFVDAATGEVTAVPLGGDDVTIVDVVIRPTT